MLDNEKTIDNNNDTYYYNNDTYYYNSNIEKLVYSYVLGII